MLFLVDLQLLTQTKVTHRRWWRPIVELAVRETNQYPAIAMSSGIIYASVTFIGIRHVRGKRVVLKPNIPFKADGFAVA